MARQIIDEETLLKLVKAGTPVEEVAEKLKIGNMNYARSKVKEALAKINAADYPGLFVGRGGGGAPSSNIQPKLSKKGSINLSKKLLDSWEIKPPEGTPIDMKVSRDKSKITLILGESSDD